MSDAWSKMSDLWCQMSRPVGFIGRFSAAYVNSLKIKIILNGKYKMEIISKTS